MVLDKKLFASTILITITFVASAAVVCWLLLVKVSKIQLWLSSSELQLSSLIRVLGISPCLVCFLLVVEQPDVCLLLEWRLIVDFLEACSWMFRYAFKQSDFNMR
jgi:hypothetical protein